MQNMLHLVKPVIERPKHWPRGAYGSVRGLRINDTNSLIAAVSFVIESIDTIKEVQLVIRCQDTLVLCQRFLAWKQFGCQYIDNHFYIPTIYMIIEFHEIIWVVYKNRLKYYFDEMMIPFILFLPLHYDVVWCQDKDHFEIVYFVN